MRVIAMLVGCLLLVGCGGGGSSAGSAKPSANVGLGKRDLPGYAVQVERVGAVLPGGVVTVRAVITAEPGQGAPVEVAAAVQADAPVVWMPGTAVGGAWTWTCTVPSGAGQRVWIRVIDGDGNSVESGTADFALP